MGLTSIADLHNNAASALYEDQQLTASWKEAQRLHLNANQEDTLISASWAMALVRHLAEVQASQDQGA